MRTRSILTLTVLLALTVALYRPVGGHQFLSFDDDQYVTANPVVKDGLTLRGLAWAGSTLWASNWHPLTWLAHMADVQLFGLDPGRHHLVSLFWHLANAALLFGLLLAISGAFWPSAATAALFAVHPLHVESVAWVAERKDLLSTFFGLLTLAAYLRYLRRPRRRRFFPVVLCFALSLLAKPMLVTMPLLLLLLDYWPFARRDRWRRLVAEKALLFAIAAASGVVTWLAQDRGGALAPAAVHQLPERVASALTGYAWYLGKMAFPAGLAVFYPRPAAGPAVSRVLLAASVLAALTLIAWAARRSRPYLIAGWTWYLLTLLPVIGLVRVGSQAVADRYTYLPLLGPFIMVAWGAAELARGRRGRAATALLAVFVIGGLAATTSAQITYWRDDLTLNRRALAVTEGNWFVHNNLGVALEARGLRDEALAEYRESLRLKPDHVAALYNLGNALRRRGDFEGAREAYSRAVRISPGFVEAHNNLGAVLLEQGNDRAAGEAFALVVRLSPLDTRARHNLGRVLERAGRVDEAVAQYREVLRQDPADGETRARLAALTGGLR